MSSNDDTYIFSDQHDKWQVKWHGQIMPIAFSHPNPALEFLDQLRAAEQACLTGKQQTQ